MDPRKDSDLQDELAQMRGEIEKLETKKLLQGDEIRALKAEARSYQDELTPLQGKVHVRECGTAVRACRTRLYKIARPRT